MNMYPALSIQRSGLNQLSNLGASGAMSSSFPALPPLLDDKDSNYTDSFHVSSGREPMENPISTQAASLVSNSSIICGQLHASSPGLRHDVHFSSVSCHGRHPQDSPFISQSSMEEASFPPCHSSQLDAQSAVLINHLDGNQDISWCSFPLQDIVTFPENVSVQNGQVESSTGVMKSEDHARTDLEWVDRWINTDLEADWNELPDVNVADPEPKQSQIHQQQQQQPPVPSGELCGVANTFSNAPPSKSRMRWTQELHEAFVQAVNQLGGSERATPKGIKNLMKVEGLTIYHVKSHLQKYRTARYKPDSSEGTSEKKLTPTEELKSIDLKAGRGITEALRLQMELQKRLHEQLENQKKLQLEIEKQGQYLEEIFKEQRRMEDGRTKVSVSTMDNPSAPLPNMVQPSHVDDKSETSKADQVKSGPGTSSVNITPEDCSWDGSRSRKHKAHESRNAEDQEPGDGDSNATPSKRARGDQMAMSSTES